MNNKNKSKEILEKVQEFASCWSLVGSRFDTNNLLQIAEGTKIEIKEDLEELELELNQAKKDQERYQMLRDAIVHCNTKVKEILIDNLTDADDIKEFDAAVDIAIKDAAP
jgi:DNA-binding protein YbaB